MRYFSGSGHDLGHVAALPHSSFLELCEELLSVPVPLPLSRDALHALPEKEQGAAKRTTFITACTFTAPARQSQNAASCNLIPLDIDDADEAKRLLAEGFGALGDLGFIAWHTARSTPEKPRLRVIVSADTIPTARFEAASKWLMALLGLSKVIVFNPVQPMFLPVRFDGDGDASPIVAKNELGDALTVNDLPASSPEDEPSGDVYDLDHLRSPMEGVTTEDAESALEVLNPDCTMQEWIEVGMGLKHQFGEAGYTLWDTWSAKGKKYEGADETEYRWGTLKANPPNRAPVTIRSVFRKAQALGWTNTKLAKRLLGQVQDWIANPSRTTEELLDHAAPKIAKISSAISSLERSVLLQVLRTALTSRGNKVTIADLRREVTNLEMEQASEKLPLSWAKGLCFVTSRNIFYQPETGRQFLPEVLDLMHGNIPMGEEKTIRPRDYLIHTVGVPQVENLAYEPIHGLKRIFKDEEGVPFVNTYRPSYVKPDPSRAAEAGAMVTAHTTHLIEDPLFRDLFLSFFAYLTQYPGEKIHWAPLLQGAEGCGKSFFAACMVPVLGRSNVRKLSADHVMQGQFNDWAYGQQLVTMEEVRIIGSNRHAIMDRLKPCITDDLIGLHKKREDHRMVKNTSNYLMFTNYHDALAIRDDGRRYFVLASRIQTPAQIAAMGGAEYFTRLFAMIRENAAGLRAWFEAYPIHPQFEPKGRAPITPFLEQMAEAASTPLALAVKETLAEKPHPLIADDLLSFGVLRAALDAIPSLPMFTDQSLAAILKENNWTKASRVLLGDVKHQLWTKGVVKQDPRQAAMARLESL